ncbi:signal recognition particle-docking protein FtsY [Xaviernesmea oryzae]|uniref:Signal recognition particle receptor FtsY n=1 Tax=Xaviernesmea oryzae TaxID=464029 RepID=A0A1Q9AXN9_9HYPH|nr:signal recognition particle-docking protein FtsY [Xaviernesmea oryzae]OLP60217.1 signal recognition particle-docking protein FtsY [Xaviernesmea oryzae]SEK27915.1 fused signal recognition particle receptor [Xaviernesmea oryzae]
MALDFIKKVFTFGKSKPAEDAARADEAALLSPDETRDLPQALDPVLAEEMETAGGPVDDEELDFEAISAAEPDPALLPPVEVIGDLGLIPLSLLEAEAEAGTQEAPLAFEQTDTEAADAIAFPADDASRVPIDDRAASEPGPLGETILEPVAGAPEAEAPSPVPNIEAEPVETEVVSSEATMAEPILPKGFATTGALTDAPDEVVAVQQKRNWFQRLREGLARTSSQLSGQITALFTKRKLDDDTLQDLEDLLIQADLGMETALRITDTLASERYGRDVSGEDVSRIMADEITKVLTPVAKPLTLDLSHKPHVILVVGVNGTGKTTTIGKLAAKLSGAGLKVMLAAGDTFRAAAIEQLKIWAERTKSHIVATKLGADAAGLAYEAFEEARRQKSDVLIIDTAGRLQNRTELMAELEKIVRVLGKLDPDAPHTVLQTLDATTGQNALNQVEIFRNVAGVNGLIMTKLDGTARGGILVAISAKHKLPVYFIGVGEGIDDLEPFEASDFARAIAGTGA